LGGDAHNIVFAIPALVLRFVAPTGNALITAAEDTTFLGWRTGLLRYEDRVFILADVADTEVFDVFAHLDPYLSCI